MRRVGKRSSAGGDLEARVAELEREVGELREAIEGFLRGSDAPPAAELASHLAGRHVSAEELVERGEAIEARDADPRPDGAYAPGDFAGALKARLERAAR